jgi:hypothetical protein
MLFNNCSFDMALLAIIFDFGQNNILLKKTYSDQPSSAPLPHERGGNKPTKLTAPIASKKIIGLLEISNQAMV